MLLKEIWRYFVESKMMRGAERSAFARKLRFVLDQPPAMYPEESLARVLGIGVDVARQTQRAGKKSLAVGIPVLIDFVYGAPRSHPFN